MKPQESTLYIQMSVMGFALIFIGVLLILLTQFVFRNPVSVIGGFSDLIGAASVGFGARIFIEEMTARATPSGYEKETANGK